MILSFRYTASALVYSLIRERCNEHSASGSFPHNRVARFVLAQHARMPDYLGLALKVLTLLFDARAIVFSGRPFHRLPHERRWRQIQSWRMSRLAPCRELVRFYERLVLFRWYELRYGRTRE